MLSGIDLLKDTDDKSGLNLLDPKPKSSKISSGLDLLKPADDPVAEPIIDQLPTATTPPSDPKSFYGTSAISPPMQGLLPMVWSPEIASYIGKQGFGPKPEGGWDEFGNPLDVNQVPYFSHEKATGVIAETLQGLSSLASHPMEIVRGGLDFALSVPGFLTGLMSASTAMAKRTIDAVVMGTDTTVEDLYNIAAEEMEKSAEFFGPGKKLLTGEPTPESELAAQVVMAPMTGLSMVGHKIADYEGFKNSPNIRGVARFAGDISGLMAMGFLLHKGNRAEFTKGVEKIVKGAEEIRVKEQAVQGTFNELIKQANQKIINAEKTQLELRAKELAKKITDTAKIKSEEAKQVEGIIKAKEIKLIEYKPELMPKEKVKEIKKAEPVKDIESKIDKEIKTVEEPKPKLELEPITEVDRMTGVEIPELKGEKSPFFQDKETTETFSNIYGERPRAIETDVELLAQKLINDVNKWYHKDETIPIDKTRARLSELATRADELRMEFINGQDHLLWKETVREAADWARGLDRLKIEPTEKQIAFHGTSSKYIKPEEMVGKYLKPKSLKDIVEDTLNEVKLTGKEKSEARQKIYSYDYFRESIKGGEGVRPFEGRGEIYVDRDFKAAAEYSEWAGEAYDNALIALGAFNRKPVGIAKKAKTIYEKNREATPYVLEIGIEGKLKKGNVMKTKPLKVTGVYDIKGTKLYSGLPLKESIDLIIKKTKPKWDKDSESWKFEVKGMIQEIYRDAEFGGWFDGQRLTPGSNRPLYLGDTKAEAIKKSIELTAENFKFLGRTFYAGLPPEQVTKVMHKLIKGTGEYMNQFKKSKEVKEFDFDYAVKQVKSDTIRSLWDQSETLLSVVRKKFPEEYNRIVSRQRSAITGKGWGRVLYEQAEREIFRDKSKEMLDATNAYILARRFKDIYSYKTDKSYKHQPGYGPNEVINMTSMIEMFKDISDGQYKILKDKFPKIDKLFSDLTPKQFKEVTKAADAYFEWSRKMVDDLVEAGLKTVEEGELLKAHDFRKFKTIRVEKLYDFNYSFRLKGESIKSTNSGVQPLGFGSTKMIEPDARTVFSEMFSRVYGSISNQAAKIEWKALAEKHPDNGIVSAKQVKHWSPMPYMDKGVRKNIYFHPDAAKYLVTQSKDISPRLASVLRGLFLAPVTRSLAVGASPAWSTFIGIPMDMMHSLWTSRTWEADAKGVKLKASYPFYETTQGKFKKVYSSFPVVDKLQLGTDMARTFRDVYKRGPLTQNLMKHGLVMNFLTQRMSRYMKGTKPPGDWAKMMDLVSYHGLSMELWVRAATADRLIRRKSKEKGITYEQGLKDKDIMYESVHPARDRMDYNQGGWLIKSLDSAGMIFLNAGVLGARTFWRQATSNPVDFTVRTGRIMATAAGITATAWMMYPEIMKDVSTKGNEKNVVWPLAPKWLKTKDIDGNDITFHLKLRMDPGGAFMYKVSENLTKTYMYDKGLIKEEPDYHELVKSLKKIGPVNLSLPPSLQAGIDYFTNYSWWKDRQMYTGLGGKTLPWGDSKHEGEFDRNVSQIAKDIGKVTGASPKRLQGAGSNVMPYNNEFVWAMGKAYEKAFSDVPEEARRQHWLITLAKTPGFNRVVGITRHGQGRWKTKGDIEDKIVLEKLIRNNEFDMLATDWAWYDARPKKEIIDFIKSQKDEGIVDAMIDKLEFISDPLIKSLPHRKFWLSMRHMSTEGRARTWTELINKVPDVEKEQLRKELAQVSGVKGIVTDEFFDALEKIQDESFQDQAPN